MPLLAAHPRLPQLAYDGPTSTCRSHGTILSWPCRICNLTKKKEIPERFLDGTGNTYIRGPFLGHG